MSPELQEEGAVVSFPLGEWATGVEFLIMHCRLDPSGQILSADAAALIQAVSWSRHGSRVPEAQRRESSVLFSLAPACGHSVLQQCFEYVVRAIPDVSGFGFRLFRGSSTAVLLFRKRPGRVTIRLLGRKLVLSITCPPS